MTPDQIVAFVLALPQPVPAAPLFPVIAVGGADARYPVAAVACSRAMFPGRPDAPPDLFRGASLVPEFRLPDRRWRAQRCGDPGCASGVGECPA
jgi:hypothetical protein